VRVCGCVCLSVRVCVRERVCESESACAPAHNRAAPSETHSYVRVIVCVYVWEHITAEASLGFRGSAEVNHS